MSSLSQEQPADPRHALCIYMPSRSSALTQFTTLLFSRTQSRLLSSPIPLASAIFFFSVATPLATHLVNRPSPLTIPSLAWVGFNHHPGRQLADRTRTQITMASATNIPPSLLPPWLPCLEPRGDGGADYTWNWIWRRPVLKQAFQEGSTSEAAVQDKTWMSKYHFPRRIYESIPTLITRLEPTPGASLRKGTPKASQGRVFQERSKDALGVALVTELRYIERETQQGYVYKRCKKGSRHCMALVWRFMISFHAFVKARRWWLWVMLESGFVATVESQVARGWSLRINQDSRNASGEGQIGWYWTATVRYEDVRRIQTVTFDGESHLSYLFLLTWYHNAGGVNSSPGMLLKIPNLPNFINKKV